MKKFSSKFIASAVMAVIAASAMAISSSAAIDYYDNPQYHVPEYTGNASGATTGGGSSSGSTDSGSQTDDDTTDETDTSESTVGSVVSESAVNAAIESGDPILVTAEDGSATIQEAAIGALRNSDSPVSFVVSDDASGFDYVVTIDPDSITEVKAIDIAVSLKAGSISGVEGVAIVPAQSGDFGMTLAITIPAAAVKELDPDGIMLFYISDDNQITDVTDALTVNDDGSVTIAISHASSYVITDVDLVALAGGAETDIDIDDDDDDDDDTDVVIDEPEQGKDDTTVVNPGSTAGADSNPVTGTTLALGSLAVFAAAAVATSKKRK